MDLDAAISESARSLGSCHLNPLTGAGAFTHRAPPMSGQGRNFAPLAAGVCLLPLLLLFCVLSPLKLMARRSHLPSDPAYLLEYMQDLAVESDSDGEFDGYLGPDDG